MNRRHLSTKVAVFISVFTAWKAVANGFALPDQDAFATARGEAFVATADNPSAIFYNPAGITQLTNNNLRAGIYAIYYEPSFMPPASAPNHNQTYYSSDNLAAVPQIFYTYSAKGAPLSFGLGIYAPFGGNIDWPQDTGFRTVATSGALQYLTINPVMAIKVLPSFSIGGGIMINHGSLTMSQGLLSSIKPLTNYFSFSGDDWSAGINLGALWQPDEKISFGATFRSQATMNFQGRTYFEVQPGNELSHRSAEADFTFPLTVVLGVSYRPTPKWNVEFDANYTGWNSFDQTTIQQSLPKVRHPFQQDILVNLGWQASWMYELGVTRYFNGGWQVSAGYVFNENSVPDQYYTPLAADMDRNFFSIGAGHKGKTFDFDIAYQFGYGPAHTVNGSSPSAKPGNFANQNADGKYGFNSNALIVSVGIHF